MIVQIEYQYNDPIYRGINTEVAKEVYVSDDWTADEIIKWYEGRHSSIHRKGIKVLGIKTLSN